MLRSLALFLPAALPEIGGAWLVWQGAREHRGAPWMLGGVLALGAYGFVATLQPEAHFGRILAADGGVLVAASPPGACSSTGFGPIGGTSPAPQSACWAWRSSCTPGRA